MTKRSLLLIFSCFYFLMGQGQSRAQLSTKKGVFYFGFGTNRSFYSRSDISFKGPNFDFTLENVRAKDDGGLKFGNGGAAQYTYQAGYYFKNKNFGIEFNFDHIKYFATHDQTVRVSGVIDGKNVEGDTALISLVQNFEHSDGANYALFNFVKWKNLALSSNKKNVLDLVLKAGAGPVIPKTNSTVMGRHFDDAYKLSGFVVAFEGGVRYSFLKNFFIAPSFKGSYARYSHFLIADGYGKQHWWGGHFVLLVGG